MTRPYDFDLKSVLEGMGYRQVEIERGLIKALKDSAPKNVSDELQKALADFASGRAHLAMAIGFAMAAEWDVAPDREET